MAAKSEERRQIKLIYGLWLAAGLVLSLTGIRWGLPSTPRVERILPPGVFGPELHERLQSSWEKIHKRIGVNLMLSRASFSALEGSRDVEPGWKTPPAVMLDSIRSFHVRTAHDDEQTLLLVLSRMRPRRLQLHPHFFAYGGAYVYPLGGWLAAGAVLGAVPLHRSMAPYLAAPEKMAAMYHWGRFASVAAYLGCIVLLLEIGRRYFTPRIGAAAAAVFLLSPAVIVQAHTMKPHMHWTFFAFLTLLLSLRSLEDGKLRSYVAAGAVSGLAIGTVVSAWPACLYVAAAAGIRAVLKPKGWLAEARGLTAAGAASLAVFLVTNPYWILDFPSVAGEFRTLQGWATLNALNPVTVALGPLRKSVTLPILGLMAAGLGWGFYRGRREPALLLCACSLVAASSVAVMIKTVDVTRQIRYFLPMIGLGGLLGAAALSEFSRRFPGSRRVAAAAALAVMANLALEGGLYAWNFRIGAGPQATYYRAGDWIEDSIPAGETVGLFRLPAPSNTAYFRYDRYRIRLMDNEIFPTMKRRDLPRFLVLTRPGYDERPALEPVFSREYERIAGFPRPQAAWASIDVSATTANPGIDIYRLKGRPPAGRN